MDSKTSTGPIVRFSSSSSTMSLEDSKCMLEIECSSSVTTLHQTSSATWSLDPTQPMKHRGGWTLRSLYKRHSGLRAQISCGRQKITGLNKSNTKTRSITILLTLERSPLTRQWLKNTKTCWAIPRVFWAARVQVSSWCLAEKIKMLAKPT